MTTLPTIQQIFTNVKNDLDSEFGIQISAVKKVALRAIAAVHTGKLWLFYKLLALLQKNIWPDTAQNEANGGTLERFGRIRLGRNPNPAVAGNYSVVVTGTIAAVIPAQTVFKSDDTSLHPGFLFILDVAHVMVTVSDTITLRALTPGTDAKLAIGNTLSSTQPLVLVNKTATVSAETVQPLAAETIEEYRAAILQSFRLEAQGGAAADYRIWALDAAGVKTVYPYAKTGETNANNIYIEAKTVDSTDGHGTPTGGIIAAVQAVIDQNPDISLALNERGRRPCTVKNYYLPVTPKPVDIIITGFTGVTATQQALILSALTNAVNLIRPFVPAADVTADRNDVLDTNKINGIIYSQIPGAVYSAITLKVSTVTVLTYTFSFGDIGYINSVTYLP